MPPLPDLSGALRLNIGVGCATAHRTAGPQLTRVADGSVALSDISLNLHRFVTHSYKTEIDQLHQGCDPGRAQDARQHVPAAPLEDRSLFQRPRFKGQQRQGASGPQRHQVTGGHRRVIMDDKGNVPAVLDIGLHGDIHDRKD